MSERAERVVLRQGKEKFFPANCLVAFGIEAAKFARDFAEERGDGGPYMVLKTEGFPPGHALYGAQPQHITIAVNGNPVRLPGSRFVPY